MEEDLLFSEINRFKIHLSDSENRRILFSAGFGAGKSFFLDNFFDHNKDYDFINLYPVDYSVTSNEDIFEIIKFDVLDALLQKYNKEISLTEEDISQALLTQEFIRNELNYYAVFKVLAKNWLPKGEAVTETIDVLKRTFEQHNSFSDKTNKKATDNAKEFISSIRQKKHSIREIDETTLMIKDFVERVKVANKKECYLIIDDLDRLDPDHIFRIFNVFTAHNDSKTELNKFGFDKVIFVCDVNNIEHMFHHRFGAKAEFSGYIDKFYSKNIYNFNNHRFLKEIYLKEFILNRKKSDSEDEIPNSLLSSLDQSSEFSEVYKRIIDDLIDADKLRIRSFKKFEKLSLSNYKFLFNGVVVDSFSYELLNLIHILRQLTPRLEDLKDSIIHISENYNESIQRINSLRGDTYFANKLIQYCLPFFFPKTAFNSSFETGTIILNLDLDDNSYQINMSLVSVFGHDFPIFRLNNVMSAGSIVYVNPYPFLLKAIENCIEHKMI